MFRVNRQTDYAIRMLLSLAKREMGVRASTTEIQQEMVIPHSYAQRVVANLARGSFIQTYPGRDGGMILARPAREINLRQLLEHFETHLFVSDCSHTESTCPLGMDCPICTQWEKLQKIMAEELEQINFEYLANNSKQIQKIPLLSLSSEKALELT
jgi:Rrf2 family protein